jgi:hypothetical protein
VKDDEMNGWLLVLDCYQDDIPIGLFASIDEVNALLEVIKQEGPEGKVIKDAVDNWRCDASVFFGVSLVVFEGGKVFHCRRVYDFDND